MNKLFPLSNITFQKVDFGGTVLRDWKSSELNFKANVVCGDCNGGWMSDIESKNAAPSMSELILGQPVAAIGVRRAHNIALFAFKTAVIANHMLPENEEFFDLAQRYAFRESLTIPPKIGMWFFGCEPGISGKIRAHNVAFTNKHDAPLALNVCTYSIGQFGFQVVAAKTSAAPEIESIATPPGLTVFFHPTLPERVSWPREVVLGGEGFNDFHLRWNKAIFR